MAVPNSRESLKQYCLRSLGKPVIDINVDEDQVEDRIDEALQYFAQYHTDGVERMYLKYKVTADDITRLTTNKKFNADEKGTVAENIELESGTNTQEEGAGDLIQESGSAVLTEDSTIVRTEYQETQNYLIVPDSVISVINVFPLSDRANLNMFDVRYQLRLNDLYDFSSTSVTTLIKRQWGQNLSKFSGTAMLGGVTLNGPELFSTALQEQQKLEEEIRTNYEEPPHIMQG